MTTYSPSSSYYRGRTSPSPEVLRLEAELDYLEAKRVLDKSYNALRSSPEVTRLEAELDYYDGKRVLDKSYEVLNRSLSPTRSLLSQPYLTREAQSAYDSASKLYDDALYRRKIPSYDSVYPSTRSYYDRLYNDRLYNDSYLKSPYSSLYKPYDDYWRDYYLRYYPDYYYDSIYTSPTKYEPVSPRYTSPYRRSLSPLRYPRPYYDSYIDRSAYRSYPSYISPPRYRPLSSPSLSTPARRNLFSDSALNTSV